MKRAVQLCQVNYAYGRNVFLPYSAGLLQAYSLSQRDIAQVYEFLAPIYLRKPIESLVEQLPQIDVLGLSCYIWNWEYSKALGKAVKERYPKCVVVLGGTQVPHQHKGFALQHPWADVLVYYEGEMVFADLLRELAKPSPRLESVNGIVICRDGKESATPPAQRIQDLECLPSPYLEGVFDSLLELDSQRSFQVSQETHRGCPYTCTFCDWGSATMNKVRQFPESRIIREYEWCARNNIDLLYNCDANYGLFPRDVALTESLVATKRAHGLPTKFRAAYAKNSNERVYEIAQLLNQEGMCKGVTLSFQSLDTNTLTAVKRKNMCVNDFKSLIDLYHRADIPTYTELILGLPEETYDSFADGIDSLLEAGQHDGINVYHAMLLENSEMSHPAYLEKYKIRGVETELLLLHGTQEPGDLREFYKIVVETSTMSAGEWVKASLFAYIVQAFHCLNLTQEIAIRCREHHGIRFREFYERLIEFAATKSPFLDNEFETIRTALRRVQLGNGSLDFGDRSFGNIMWPIEEILFLRLLKNRFSWVNDLLEFLQTVAPDDDAARLMKTQEDSTRSPETEGMDWPTFAREAVWYGRKGGSLRRNPMRERQVIV